MHHHLVDDQGFSYLDDHEMLGTLSKNAAQRLHEPIWMNCMNLSPCGDSKRAAVRTPHRQDQACIDHRGHFLFKELGGLQFGIYCFAKQFQGVEFRHDKCMISSTGHPEHSPIVHPFNHPWE